MKASFLSFLLWATILAAVARANETQRRSASCSTPERALFGYSSAEDCLFGTSSVLTRNVRFTGGEEVTRREDEHEATSEELVPRPAFVANTQQPKK